jgi:hypothetical protein
MDDDAAERVKRTEVTSMRRQVVSWVFVAGLAGVAPLSASASPSVDEVKEATVRPVAVQRAAVPVNGLRDEAAMVLVGSALIGLAAAVRRAA